MSRKDPFITLSLPVIFRILYCCGTRVGETLRIRVRDVDLESGIIALKETKNDKERYIVLSDELNSLVRRYADRCLYLKKEDDYFFAKSNGERISEQMVYHYHRKALDEAGIRYLGGGNGPRLHDLRHTFAVKSLMNFEKEGCDLCNVLPILSRYLGHKKVTYTEKYLQLVLGHFDELINKTQGITSYLLEDSGNETD